MRVRELISKLLQFDGELEITNEDEHELISISLEDDEDENEILMLKFDDE